MRGLRFGPVGNAHLTLRFLGSVGEELVEGVAEAKLDAAWPFRDPGREDRLLVHLAKDGGLTDKQKRIVNQLIEEIEE